MSLLSTYDALLFDLDGTVWEGGQAIPDAVETIAATDLPKIYVTNNASRAAGDVAERLAKIGVPATESDVLTSAQAAVELAAAAVPAGSAVYVVGTDSFRELARAAGFVVVDSADDQPQAVLQGHNPQTGWAHLSEAALAIRGGAQFFASNLDTSLPSERGLLVGNGSMVAAVVSATGVTPTAAGKPEPAMFHSAAEKLSSDRPLVIGDRLDTDIQGGVAAGMDTFQVLTGVSGPWALLRALKVQRPTYIAESLRDLYRPSAELLPSAQGGFHARIEAGELVLSGGNPGAGSVAALRTALATAWQTGQGSDLPDAAFATVRTEGDTAAEAVAAWW